MAGKHLAYLNEILALREEWDNGRFFDFPPDLKKASLSLRERYEQDKRKQQIQQAFGKRTSSV